MLQVEIRVEGCLDERWSEWLDGLSIAAASGGTGGGCETVLTGPIVDQAALYGLISKLRDLGTPSQRAVGTLEVRPASCGAAGWKPTLPGQLAHPGGHRGDEFGGPE